MTREIFLDTETTGLCRQAGRRICAKHRVIEIAAIETIDGVLTGNKFHTYLNPGREVEGEAHRINGLTLAMLEGKPYFEEIAYDFLKFIKGSILFIHNASFDIEFLNQELEIIKWPPLDLFYNSAICTKKMSDGLSLDTLCAKYKIDTSGRKIHGALIDAELLVKCYRAMTGKLDDPAVLKSSVNNCLDEFYAKYAKKPEGVLIQEIQMAMENLENWT